MKILLSLFSFLLLISCSEPSRFTLVRPEKSGIEFGNFVTETDSFHVMSYEYIYNGAGVGIGDLNNDGLQDIVFAGNHVSPRIYINAGNFRFRDITGNFQDISNGQWYSSVTIADINNDGWTDVYLTSTANTDPEKCKNRLWINGGVIEGKDPVFLEKAEEYGIAEKGQSVNAAFLDYDLDGDLDLYVMNNTVNERMNTSYRVKMVDGSAMNNDRLYRNEGNGKFTDVTIEAGIVFEGFGLGLAVGDVNKDGYPDIYVSNDYISNDLLYINQKNGTFKNEIRNLLSYQTKSSMGNDMADVNNDGLPDIYTMDMMPESYERIKQTINGFSYIFYVNDAKYDYEHQYLRNMLHVHNGFLNGELIPFSEHGQMSGIFKTEWSWSPLFADYDNDGDRDLLISNGYPRDMTDKDWTRYKAEVYGFVANEAHVIEMAPAVKVPNMAYENKGDLVFERKGAEWLPQVPSYSYGAAFADLDNDGDLDYVTNNLNDKAFVYRNNTVERSGGKSGFIKIKLSGSPVNTMAIGAKIELWASGKYQFAEHFMTRGYASSVDPVTHFGLGDISIADSVKITWPGGDKISVYRNVAANQLINAAESEAIPVNISSIAGKRQVLPFEKVDGVLDYRHEQTDYIDFFLNQNIIPHKFSQIGPCMVQGDLDGDGKNDILAGSTNAGPTTAFVRKSDSFIRVNIEGLTGVKTFTEAGLAIADVDNDGDNDVIAVAGAYENQDESEFKHYLYRNSGGKFSAELLPVPPFSASVVRLCDFDRDGDQDVFIGSRIKKGMYPYATHSWVLRNDNGRFAPLNPSGLNLGMVTDAVWTDIDGDGFDDLLVAREWNSIGLVKNSGGSSLEYVTNESLESFKGLWYSLAACDLDLDGDMDLIAGNLGKNIRISPGEANPMRVYALDIDNDGSIDPVITAWWPDNNGAMQEYPLSYFDELCAQSAFFRDRFSSYTDFSKATINDIFDEEIKKRIDFSLDVNTLSSYVVWNEGGGKMRFEELPSECQVSPLTRIIVKDINSDKYPDVIIGGNDYSWDVATGYFDASKGFVLVNGGSARTFAVLPPSRSGLLLQGMVQSLLLIDGDYPIIVAGMNRSRALVYRLNPKAQF